MTRKYSLVIEGDAAGFSVYVAAVPEDRSPTSQVKEIEVELPA
jgi:hypothetical protein